MSDHQRQRFRVSITYDVYRTRPPAAPKSLEDLDHNAESLAKSVKDRIGAAYGIRLGYGENRFWRADSEGAVVTAEELCIAHEDCKQDLALARSCKAPT